MTNQSNEERVAVKDRFPYLAVIASRDGNRLEQDCFAVLAALETSEAEAERLRALVERNKSSAVHRLHNLCDGLAEDAAQSPFTREEWDRIDRQTVHMQKQLREIADAAARGLKHVDDLSALDVTQEKRGG